MKKDVQKFICLLLVVLFSLSSVQTSMVFADNVSSNANQDKDQNSSSGLELSDVQKNSMNMLNYLSYVTQDIQSSKNSRADLEEIYSLLINNIDPNAVDSATLEQLNNMLDLLESFRMISTKRNQVNNLYGQQKANAIASSFDEVELSVAIGGDKKKGEAETTFNLAAAVVKIPLNLIFEAVGVMTEVDMETLRTGWELDEEQTQELHTSRKNLFNYMVGSVQNYNLPTQYAFNEKTIEEFVSWKNNTNVTGRIQYLTTNQSTFDFWSPYWLVLLESYCENAVKNGDEDDYQKALEAFSEYEKTMSPIFRKDYDYAKAILFAMTAAREVYDDKAYYEFADQYLPLILENTDNDDWEYQYYVAQTYRMIGKETKNTAYLQKAYDTILNTVNALVPVQLSNNAIFMNDLVEENIPKDASKALTEELKKLNQYQKDVRWREFPPVSNALLMAAELMYTIADELNVPDADRVKMNNVLHSADRNLFLNPLIENVLLDSPIPINAADIEISFDESIVGNVTGEKEIILPAKYFSSQAKIVVTVTDGTNTSVIDDWRVTKVERKDPKDIDSFKAYFVSEKSCDVKMVKGQVITISIIPLDGYETETLEFVYDVTPVVFLGQEIGVNYERR